jgi:hypothetical protein
MDRINLGFAQLLVAVSEVLDPKIFLINEAADGGKQLAKGGVGLG